MAKVNWTDGSDNWTTAADWSTGAVPGSGDDVTIPSDGFPQITSNVGTVASVTVGNGTGDFSGLMIQGGALATTGDFTLSATGSVDVDQPQGTGGSTLAVGGTLVTASGGRLIAGSAAPSAPVSITAAALSNAGSLSLSGGASTLTSLDVASAAGFGTAGTLTGGVGLSGDAQIVFEGGGQITTIAAGGGLSLVGALASIADAGGVVNSALSTLATLNGGLTLQDGAMLTTTTTLTVANGVTFNVDSNQGPTTTATLGGLANAGNIRIEGQNGHAAQLASNAAASNTGTVELDGISGGTAAFDVAGGLDNSGTLEADMFGAEGGSSVAIAGALTNEATGSIKVGNTALDAATDVSATALTNAGTLTLAGGPSTATTLTIGSAAGFGTAGTLTGMVSLTDDAHIIFASGSIGTIAAGANLTLDGAGASIADSGSAANSALAGPLTIDGTLDLEGTASLATSAMTVAQGGQLDLAQEAAGPTLTIGGALTLDAGEGNIEGGSATIGARANTFNGAAPTTVSVQSLDVAAGPDIIRSGSLALTGSTDTSAPAVLDVASAAGFGTTGVVTGDVSLTGDATIQFQSGTLGSIAANSSLTLSGANAALTDVGGGTALDLSNVAGGLEVANGATLTTGALAVSGQLDALDATLTTGAVDLSGSADVESLTGQATLDISALTLEPGALLFSSGAMSLLSIGSAAPANLANRIEVDNGGTIQFASGQITDISTGGVLIRGGGSIADAGGSANSALSTLSTIGESGFLDLEASSSLTTTVGLTNAGGIGLDGAGNDGGSNLTIGGVLTNTGVVALGDTAATPPVPPLTADDSVTANGLVNDGTIRLVGGSLNPRSPSGTSSLTINGDAVNNQLLVIGDVNVLNAGPVNANTVVGAFAKVSVSGAFTQNANALTSVYGTLDAGSLTLAANSIYLEDLNGTSANTFGVAEVTGPVSLGGATLEVSPDYAFTPTAGQTYTIIDNEGTGTVSGTFAGLAQGASFASDGEEFSISYTGGDGNDVVLTDEGAAPVCFAQGTRIATVRGEIAVEALVVGDLALTAAGAARPIRWLGHRTINCRSHPSPADVHPVRIAAHAFGAGQPARDLYLSPGHPVLVGAHENGEGGYLVPIMCLINGTTVRRQTVDSVTYWHIELDAHDILLAEGLPAESYIDLGSRPWFAGADGALCDPDMALPGMPGRCRPVAVDGPVVEAERQRLDMMFAVRLAAAAAWPVAEDALAL